MTRIRQRRICDISKFIKHNSVTENCAVYKNYRTLGLYGGILRIVIFLLPLLFFRILLVLLVCWWLVRFYRCPIIRNSPLPAPLLPLGSSFRRASRPILPTAFFGDAGFEGGYGLAFVSSAGRLIDPDNSTGGFILTVIRVPKRSIRFRGSGVLVRRCQVGMTGDIDFSHNLLLQNRFKGHLLWRRKEYSPATDSRTCTWRGKRGSPDSLR